MPAGKPVPRGALYPSMNGIASEVGSWAGQLLAPPRTNHAILLNNLIAEAIPPSGS